MLKEITTLSIATIVRVMAAVGFYTCNIVMPVLVCLRVANGRYDKLWQKLFPGDKVFVLVVDILGGVKKEGVILRNLV